LEFYKKQTILLIAIASIVRCIIAVSISLGNDEVYYRMYAAYLQWNYFDHPPMVGLLIRLTTFNLFLDNIFFIRLGAILSVAIVTWLLFLCGKKLKDAYTGFLAAIIYTASIYGSIIAGLFILPDAPQMVCWVAGLYLLIDIVASYAITNKAKKKMILFGIIAGVGMLCKVHTIFLWLGIGTYIICFDRRWLMQPSLYFAAIFTLVIFYPVIQWNIDNHFITYQFHSNRVAVTDAGINFTSFFTFFGGQIFYYNPIVFVCMFLALVAALRKKLPILLLQNKLLLCCSLPLIIICVAVSLFKNMLPHWSGPSSIALTLLTAAYFSNYKTIPKAIKFAVVFIISISLSGALLINFYPGTLGKKENAFLGEGDFTLDMYGWKNLKDTFEQIRKKDSNNNIMKSNAAIVCNKWFPAAHIDKYVAMPLKINFVVIGDTNDIHQYAWINKEREKLIEGDDAYCIVPSNNYEDVNILYSKYFTTILLAQIIEQKRNGKNCRLFYLYRLKYFKG
jgi:Dolichyl-phosphate-mannose-protein mannosyltransferase